MWLIIVIIVIVIVVSIGKDYYPILLAKLMPPTRNDVSMDNMSGEEFERFCAKLLISNNYKNVKTTKSSGDHGIDILATKDDLVYAIQCKCYQKNVGNSAVQEAYTGRELYNANYSVVMTNRYFSPQAQAEAKRLGVLLWDRDTISSLQMKSPIDFEKKYDEPREPEQIESRNKLFPAGIYIVGEDLEPGRYMLICSSRAGASVKIYNSYDEYRSDDYPTLGGFNFDNEYQLLVKNPGECVRLENCFIERKL